MAFPRRRMRRMRRTEGLRRMVRGRGLTADGLVLPLFVREGEGIRSPVDSLPGHFQLSVDEVVKEAREAEGLGIPAVLLFGIPDEKDERGSQAFAEDGIVQRAIRAIKKEVPGLTVIGDVCLCEYTSHGHCGLIGDPEAPPEERRVDNDATLELLARTAVAQARAGADIVAPSAMMDGQVAAIRGELDADGRSEVAIMAYAAKYSSSFYGPFREAAESAMSFGDRRAYQMGQGAPGEAMEEMELDLEEGADILMVKPALAYMDIIRDARERFDCPLAAYSVSGEYSMVQAAAANGWLDGRRAAMEILQGLVRAGADIIITYWAKDAVKWMEK